MCAKLGLSKRPEGSCIAHRRLRKSDLDTGSLACKGMPSHASRVTLSGTDNNINYCNAMLYSMALHRRQVLSFSIKNKHYSILWNASPPPRRLLFNALCAH
jgi:hypothetical protein